MSVVIPNYATGYAKNRWESEAPEQWDGLVLGMPFWFGNTGAKVFDHSLHRNHGAWAGSGTHWTEGPRGVAGQFNDTDDVVSVADRDCLSFGNGTVDTPCSISMWVVIRDYTSVSLLSKGALYANGEYNFGIEGLGRFNMILIDNSATKYIGRSSTTSMQGFLNIWTHLAGSYDGSKSCAGVKLYRNGVRCDDIDRESLPYTAMENLGQPVTIGNNSNCDMDDVRIYNRELTPGEMAAIYADPTRLWRRRSIVPFVYVAAGGISIPVAMNHYRKLRV